MGETKSQRELGLDLVRATAGVLVLSVHFFLNNGFYQTPVAGGAMLLSCMVRMLCMTCVPLFMLLTGYTCIHRTWSWGYYRKLVPIVLTYLLAGVVCVAARGLVLGEELGLGGAVRLFFSTSAVPYGWYIEMYIGLFLVSPFLNAAWKTLSDQAKGMLVFSLVFMTALPPLINQWKNIFPDWWVGVYPLTYYAIGAWLREHPLKLKGWQCFGLWLALAALMGLKGYYTAQGGIYLMMIEDDWGSWALTLQAVLLFSCLVKLKRAPKPVAWCISRVAKLTLGMYLVSWVADQIVYPRLIAAVPLAHTRIFWMPLTVLTTVIMSCLLAQVIEWARVGVTWCINKICPKAELR